MRIAVTDFLNARPLIYGLEESGARLSYKSPKECAQALESGEVDFALLPSIEYARLDGISIVPEISISSMGPVRSVLLFLKKEPSQIQRIAIDQRSRTAATLLKILAKEFFKIDPQYSEISPGLKTQLMHDDAILLIGDHALREVASFEGSVIDLGQAWNRWTGLPFTYAFWAGRAKEANPDFLIKFYEARERGVSFRPQIAREATIEGLEYPFILEYLTKNICYDWSTHHEEGLKLFYELAFKHGLIEKIPEIKFYEAEEYSFKSLGRKKD
jgi:chorismate dehydratase